MTSSSGSGPRRPWRWRH